MPTHRRGRSLSEALTLEQSEEGGLVISSISGPSQNQSLKKGDEILGATINFDKLSKEEVLKVLKLMEPFDDKIQVLTRDGLSKSVGNLDQCGRSPETMLKDSYSKLYNAKIKKFMMGDLSAEENRVNREVDSKPKAPASSKVGLEHDMGLPRLGVDFGLLKSKTEADPDPDPQADAKDLTYGSNMNLPPMGLGSNGITLSDSDVPRVKIHARNPQLNAPDFHLLEMSPDDPDTNTAAGMCMPSALGDVPTNIEASPCKPDFPKVDIEGLNPEFQMPKFKMPNLALTGPSICDPHCEFETSAAEMPDYSSCAKPPRFKVSGKLPEADLEKSSFNVPHLDVNGTNTGLSLSDVNVSLKKQKTDLQSNKPTTNLKGLKLASDTPSVSIKGLYKKSEPPKFTMPKFDLPDIQSPDLKGDLGQLDGQLTAPTLEGEIMLPDSASGLASTNLDIKSPSGKLKIPGVKHSEYDLNTPETDVDVPNVKGSKAWNRENAKLHTPELNARDVHTPSLKIKSDANAPSGKFKLPKFKLFGTLPKKKSVDVDEEVNITDPGISGPSLKAGIKTKDMDLPKTDLKNPRLKNPDVNLDMPSGKLKMPELRGPDWDVNVPSGKMKMPKLNLSGALPKGPNLDVNADLKSPDVSLQAPKIKGEMNAPDLNLPDMNPKAPKLDFRAKELNIGSPKTKMTFPSDMDVNSPPVNIDSPQNYYLAGRKFKLPSFKTPQFGSSELKHSGSDIDFSAPLRSTNIDISPPNSKLNLTPGEAIASITLPKVNPNMGGTLPKAKMSNPQLHLRSPDLNLDNPSLKFQKSSNEYRRPNMKNMSIKMPDLDIDNHLESHTSRKSKKNKVGSSYHTLDNAMRQDIDLSYGDLNIDDFTGKDHVLRARGSKLDLQAPQNYDEVIPSVAADVSMGKSRSIRQIPDGNKDHKVSLPGVSESSQVSVPDSSGGYYVTVFPTKTESPKIPNCKYNTMGRLDFHPGNLDLEVPDENNLKDSTYFLSNLV